MQFLTVALAVSILSFAAAAPVVQHQEPRPTGNSTRSHHPHQTGSGISPPKHHHHPTGSIPSGVFPSSCNGTAHPTGTGTHGRGHGRGHGHGHGVPSGHLSGGPRPTGTGIEVEEYELPTVLPSGVFPTDLPADFPMPTGGFPTGGFPTNFPIPSGAFPLSGGEEPTGGPYTMMPVPEGTGVPTKLPFPSHSAHGPHSRSHGTHSGTGIPTGSLGPRPTGY